MPYVPGDNWIICDLSGIKLLQSESVKTWDGYRVHPRFWYPRHPQLDVRGVPDYQNVIDGRPRPVDLFIGPTYGVGSFCLTSPNGTRYVVYVGDDGAVMVVAGTFGNPVSYLTLGNYHVTVDDDGAVHVTLDTTNPGVGWWDMTSPGGYPYRLTVDPDLAVLVTSNPLPVPPAS
jgi:hypothetical protein